MSAVSRKMRKNFAGVLVAISLGIMVCFALVNLVLMAEPEDTDARGSGRISGHPRASHLRSSSPLKPASMKRSASSAVHYSNFVSTGSGGAGGGLHLHRLTSGHRHFVPPYRVVHLDFKGAPPNLAYLKEFMGLVAKAGANGILVEYEDMFPYWGSVANASALNAFTKEQIGELLEAARSSGLEVIPLIQTFGHLEHVLKLEEFVSLREVPRFPQSICPSKSASVNVITTMIDQVMSLHAGYSQFLHIGCDEVYQLGLCSQCRNKLKASAAAAASATSTASERRIMSPRDLFVQHVTTVAQYVKTRHRVQPIIWDDMLRSMSLADLAESGLGDLVEPMVWVYVEDIDHFVEGSSWGAYSNVFDNIWAASAFKGAFGERLFMPNVLRHYRY